MLQSSTRSNKGKTPLDLAPEDSLIKELLLSPPGTVIPVPAEKAHSEMNGFLDESGKRMQYVN